MSAPQRPPLRDSKSNLYAAALEVVKAKEQAPPPAAPPGRRSGLLILVLVALLAILLLLLRPIWLVGPSAPPREPAGIAAASLRLELLRERQRVLLYSQEHGRLPASLAETGSRRADFEYLQEGLNHFRLSGRAGDSVVTLRSSDSLAAFLGESLRRFKSRGTE